MKTFLGIVTVSVELSLILAGVFYAITEYYIP